MFPPTAKCDKLDKTLVRDVLHQKADFIHVTSDQHARSFAGEITEHRAHAIGEEIAAVAKFIDEDRAYFVFVTRYRMGLGELAQQ